MTSPERSLGSNQVLFGGMIWPASAMSISWATVVGYIEEGHAAGRVHAAEVLAGSADAADKVDALTGARIIDAENWGQELLLEDADVEPGHRIRFRVGGASQAIPLAAEIHAHAPGRLGVGRIHSSSLKTAPTFARKAAGVSPFRSVTIRW